MSAASYADRLMIVAGSADSIDVGMSTSPSPGSIDDNGSSTSAELSSSRTRRSANDQLCILGSPYLSREELGRMHWCSFEACKILTAILTH